MSCLPVLCLVIIGCWQLVKVLLALAQIRLFRKHCYAQLLLKDDMASAAGALSAAGTLDINVVLVCRLSNPEMAEGAVNTMSHVLSQGTSRRVWPSLACTATLPALASVCTAGDKKARNHFWTCSNLTRQHLAFGILVFDEVHG